MIVGIGCDIVDHKVTSKLRWDIKNSSRERIFSQAELNICIPHEKIAFLSGRFAAKEAIVKCLGTGMQDGIALSDIEILQDLNGKPIVKLNRDVKELSDSMGISFWHICITHTVEYTLAYVLAERN